MKDTVCDKCVKRSCPNKIELQWFDENGQAHPIVDCAPKRTLLMQREVHQRLIGFQSAMETMRNEMNAMKKSSEGLKSLFQYMPQSQAKQSDYAPAALPYRELQDRS